MLFNKWFYKLLIIGIIFCSFTVKASNNTKEKKDSHTYKLYGTIIDRHSGEHLTGVIVKVNGANTQTITDLDGNFVIEFTKPGKYVILSEYISYKKNTTDVIIDLKKYHKINILLVNE